MKMINLTRLLAASSVCLIASTALAATLQEIERMPFDEAYGLWLKEQAAHPPAAVAIGSADPKAREFTPTTFWALTCRLGQEARNHEAFLQGALATNAWVSAILDTSASLCTKYHVASQAVVRYDPKGGYTEVMRDWIDGPDTRKGVWLKALAKLDSQPDGSANGSQPIHAGTNTTSGAAGSRR